MKRARETVHEHGRLHGHFGGSGEFALVEVDPQAKVALRTEIVPAPEQQPGLFPRWLREPDVEVVIAGGIGRRALAIFAEHGITVRAGLPGRACQNWSRRISTAS
jgi:predicted Fe-Mo cluster-binding NifX family protein